MFVFELFQNKKNIKNDYPKLFLELSIFDT